MICDLGLGFAMNPARDLGPRMLMAMVGYDNEIWNYRGWVLWELQVCVWL